MYNHSQAEQRLRRLGKAYVDGLYLDDDYRREKRGLEEKLAGLVVPEVAATREVGKLLEELPNLWEQADLGERRKFLVTMLDAVYVDTVEEKSVVALKPKPAFRALFQIATTREGSGFFTKKILRTISLARRMTLSVCGGDGGEWNYTVHHIWEIQHQLWGW